jgi:serine phosphatase RsbU (regulator of sigma subunit)
MFDGGTWPESRFTLAERWSILLYTDGVIERRDAEGRLLGDEGLRRLIENYVDREPGWRADPRGLLTELLTRVRELNSDELSDDVAMVLIGRR